jgi:hypothetical protein
MKYVGGNTLRAGLADSGNILARYVGGDSPVLSGAMTGADGVGSDYKLSLSRITELSLVGGNDSVVISRRLYR